MNATDTVGYKGAGQGSDGGGEGQAVRRHRIHGGRRGGHSRVP